MLNKVTLIGRLGRDPETRRLTSGDPVTSFGLATSERWTDKSTGEKKERTEWHNIIIYNEHLCKLAGQYLKKGSKVYIEGQISSRKFTDKDGVDRTAYEIVLQRFGGAMTLLDDPERRAPPEPDSYGTTRTRDEGSSTRRDDRGAGTGGKPSYELDDDIPF